MSLFRPHVPNSSFVTRLFDAGYIAPRFMTGAA